MKINVVAGLAAVATAFLAASARSDPAVDRERLKGAATLPWTGNWGWYYSWSTDGRVYEGGTEPDRAEPSAIRAAIKGDDSDVGLWMDLAAVYRRLSDTAQEVACVANATAILQRQAAAHPDDGQTLAALGLALAASRDDDGAGDAIKRAKQAAADAWAGAAADADLLVMRCAAQSAGRRFATLSEAVRWLAEPSKDRAPPNATQMGEAAKQYDAAVAGVEKSGARGRGAVSVYWRRRLVRGALRRAGPAPIDRPGVGESAEDDYTRRSADLLPDDPFVLTMVALDDAMSEPDAAGGRHVEEYGRLPKTAQEKLDADLARLDALARSADAETASRALQGTACLTWFCRRDAAATESILRSSIAKDPRVQQSWKALVLVLSTRWKDVAKLCEDWIKVGDTAGRRMVLANALFQSGRAEDAEKNWRVAQSLEPKSFAANLGVAVLVLRRSEDDADLNEATRSLRAAAVALAEPDPWGYWWGATLDAATAVRLGLAGDVDGAEIAARRMLASDPKSWQAKQILSAIGR